MKIYEEHGVDGYREALKEMTLKKMTPIKNGRGVGFGSGKHGTAAVKPVIVDESVPDFTCTPEGTKVLTELRELGYVQYIHSN